MAASLCTQTSLVEPRAISTSCSSSLFVNSQFPWSPGISLSSFLFPAPPPVLHPCCHCLRQDTTAADRCFSLCVECPALVFAHTCDWPEIPTAQIMSLLCSKTSHCLQDNIQILHLDTSIPSYVSCPNAAQHCQMTQQSPTCPVFKASTSAHGLICLQLSLFLE